MLKNTCSETRRREKTSKVYVKVTYVTCFKIKLHKTAKFFFLNNPVVLSKLVITW